MSALSDYLENKLVDFIFRGVSYTPPTTLYVALFTAPPSDSGGGTEVSGTSYARKSVAASTAEWAATNATGSTAASSSGSGGVTSNNNPIIFATPGGSWGTVTHFGIFDEASAGNLLLWGALTVQQTINTGNTVSFAAGQLQVTFA